MELFATLFYMYDCFYGPNNIVKWQQGKKNILILKAQHCILGEYFIQMYMLNRRTHSSYGEEKSMKQWVRLNKMNKCLSGKKFKENIQLPWQGSIQL